MTQFYSTYSMNKFDWTFIGTLVSVAVVRFFIDGGQWFLLNIIHIFSKHSHPHKFLLCFLLVLILHISLYSQVVSISPTKMNVLYLGVDNPLTIVVENHDCSEVVVKARRGDYIKGDSCLYIYRDTDSCSAHGIDRILVGVHNNGNDIWLDSVDFWVKRVPDPTPYFAAMKSNMAGSRIVVSGPCIIPKVEHFDYDVNFRITEHSFSVFRTDSLIFQELHIQGNCISSNSQAAMNKCINDDKVLIYNIHCFGPDKCERILRDTISFVIRGKNEAKPDLVFDAATTSLLLLSNRDKITEVPPSVLEMEHLRELEIRGSDCDTSLKNCYRIKEIPYEIKNLQKLEKLSLAYQNIALVPQELAEIESLTYIDLSGNYGLKDIDVFTSMPWIEALILYDCKLVALPADIGKLKKLKLLDIRYTNIPEVEYQRIKKSLPKCEIKYKR